MTLTVFTQLPDSVALGAQVSFMPSTAKNPSESGNNNRFSLRPIKRNYTVSISPDDSDEMQAIIMALLGDRFPLAMRDYAAYQVTAEDCQFDNLTGDWLMGRTWAPSTGNFQFFERILVPESMVVSLNGSPATTSSYAISDFGRIQFSGGVTTSDTVSITGTYLTPVALMDAPALQLFGSIGGVPQSQFSSMRFEQLYEKELIDILAEAT